MYVLNSQHYTDILIFCVIDCYFLFQADIVLFLLTSMVILLLNNCGNDRRLALSIMSFGDPDQHTMKK